MKVHKTRSENNYKILHVQKDSPVSLVLFLVKNGSRNETKETAGISHFVEHMMFKATKTRTTSKGINAEIESIGGVTNAFTGHEYTGYYIQVLKENFNHAFEIMSDLLQNGVLNEKDIEIEKGVVIEEIRMYEDSPTDKVGLLYQANIFPDQQLGVPIIGSEETVKSFTGEQLKHFIQEQYLQEDFLVVSVGDFSIDQTIENTVKYLKPRPQGSVKISPAKFNPKNKIDYFEKKDANQAHSVISFEGVSTFTKDLTKYEMVDIVLGDGMSSILFDLLREQLGVAYYVGTNHSDYLDTGVFNIYFGTNFDKTKMTVDRIFEEIEKIKTKLIDEKELDRAKNYIYSKIAMSHENIGYLGRSYGFDYLFRDEIETLEKKREKIFAVTREDILETSRKIFTDNYNITYIANKKLL